MLVSGSLCEGCVHRKIGRGIDQHLAGEFRAIAVARRKRHHGGEIAAGAVAADRQSRGVDAELLSRSRRSISSPRWRRRRRRGICVRGRGGSRPRSRSIRLHARACGRPRHGNRDRRSPSRRHGKTPGRARGHRSCAMSSACRCAPGSRHAAPGSTAVWRIPVPAARDWRRRGAARYISRAFRCRHRLIRRAAGFLERLVDGGGIGIENNGHR